MTERHLGRMRKLYEYMSSHVSKSPRAAYLDHRDIDLGRTSYRQAGAWGSNYFLVN